MANRDKTKPEAEFRHRTTISATGTILFDAPIQIHDHEDFDHYHITRKDCRTLNFHGSEKILVYFIQVESRELAEFLWSSLDTSHSSSYAKTRCWVPGRRKAYIRCSDRHSCTDCPFGRTPETKQSPLISLDSLIESGYEPEYDSDEQRTSNRQEYASIREKMDAIDSRIARAFELREMYGYSVKEIAKMMGLSEPRVYQLIQRAKQIGTEYRKENEHEIY